MADGQFVSRETEEQLTEFAALLTKWNKRINLVAPSTIADLRARHIDDCVQLAAIANPEHGHWADFGTGGGFPGLILAICQNATAVKFTLVESDQRKSAFLRTAIRELGLKNCEVLANRIEEIEPLECDYISARALAPLYRLMPYVVRHMKVDGTAWFMKGENWRKELDEAQAQTPFNYDAFDSRTNPDAAILKLTGFKYA